MEKKRHRNIALTAAAILLCLVLVTTFLVSGMLARYTVSDSGGDLARVAAFVFRVSDGNNSHIIDLQGVDRPGASQSYTFSVRNYAGTVKSEVSESAKITLSLNGSIPLTCAVKESGSQTDLVTVTRTNTGIDAPVTDSNDAWDFQAIVQTEKTYVLTVSWPAADNDLNYASAGTVSKLVMTVTGTQID